MWTMASATAKGGGVTIGRRTMVFKVTLLLLADSLGNADAGTAVGNTSRKVIDVGDFKDSSQMLGMVQAFPWDHRPEYGTSSACFTMASSMYFRPFSQMALVQKLVWHLAPFWFPGMSWDQRLLLPQSFHIHGAK